MIFPQRKGIRMFGTIALDIDGTLTADSRSHTMPQRVVDYLTQLAGNGWQLIFITGRTFQAGYKILQPLPFNYYFAVQNGAIILSMPSRQIVAKKYLDASIFAGMDAVCQDEPSDFVVYTGFENQDVCYYRPRKFSTSLLNYLEGRTRNFKETWIPLESYADMPIKNFPSVKCFGLYESALQVANKIKEQLGLYVPLIRDPFDEMYYVVQATHPEITKGQALLDFLKVKGRYGKIIAAGDDNNDVPMLEAADIKIAMANSPQVMLDMADIVAPPATEEGILIALEEAIRR